MSHALLKKAQTWLHHRQGGQRLPSRQNTMNRYRHRHHEVQPVLRIVRGEGSSISIDIRPLQPCCFLPSDAGEQ
jgi:hypothetical protein